MRGAGQGRRGNQQKALGVARRLEGLQLVRRHEADHRVVLARRLKVLPDGEEIDFRRAQVVHQLQHLVPLLPEADHDAGLCEDGRVESLHPLQEPDGVEVARAGPNLQVL